MGHPVDRPGWDIPREPGSQAPTKSSGSHEMLAEIYALSQTYIFLSKKFFATGRNFLPQEDF